MFSTINPRLLRNIKVKSYHDRVSFDASNKVFYLYYLGRYHNTPYYCYGETFDIDIVDYSLKKTLPYSVKKFSTPIEDRVYNIDIFEKYIKKNKAPLPLSLRSQDFNTFITNDEVTLDIILDILEDLYNTKVQND